MEEPTITTTHAVESDGSKDPSQVENLPVQSDNSQTETVSTPVESSEQSPTSPVTERPKPSDFYGIRKLKSELKDLRNLVSQLPEQLKKELGSKQPSETKPTATPQEMERMFYENPVQWALEREKQLKQEMESKISALESKFPEMLKQSSEGKQYEVKRQEALEILFPKDSANPNETLEQRFQKNQDRVELIEKIIEEYKLDDFSRGNPIEAAKIVSQILNQSTVKKNPSIPTKGQMSSVATGTPSGGGKRSMTLDEIKAERDRLDKEANANPELRQDPKWQEKRNLLKAELSKSK